MLSWVVMRMHMVAGMVAAIPVGIWWVVIGKIVMLSVLVTTWPVESGRAVEGIVA